MDSAAPEVTVAPSALSTAKRVLEPFSVDARLLLDIVDPRPVVWPVTPRRVGYFAAYAGIIVGGYMLESKTHVAQTINAHLHASPLAGWILLGILYGLEPVLMAALVFTAKIPNANPKPPDRPRDPTDPDAHVRRARTENVALLIPAHREENTIAATLQAALRHFPPRNIIVLDNAKEDPTVTSHETPARPTAQAVAGVDPDITYRFVPEGNKTIAQHSAAVLAGELGCDVVMTIDADVELPPNFIAPLDKLQGNTHAVMIPIKGVHKSGHNSWFTNVQAAEYHFADLAKMSEAATGTVLTPHGAASFWVRETFVKILRKHNLEYFGDDLQMGRLLTLDGKRMDIDARFVVDTEAPSTVIGKGLNYYKQRVRSWNMASHMDYPNLFKTFFTSRVPDNTVHGLAMQKMSQFMLIVANAADFLRVPTMALMGGDPSFWWKFAGFSASSVIPLMAYKYKARHRPDMQIEWSTILNYPLYKNFVYNPCATLGAVRAYAMYYPGKKSKVPIPEMEAANVPSAVWTHEAWLRVPPPQSQALGRAQSGAMRAYTPSVYSRRTTSSVYSARPSSSLYSHRPESSVYSRRPASSVYSHRTVSPAYQNIDGFVRSPISVIPEDNRSSIDPDEDASIYSRDTDGVPHTSDGGSDEQRFLAEGYLEPARPYSPLDA